jgi:predicted ATPase/tetratricopeptide (TPR) repeat protein
MGRVYGAVLHGPAGFRKRVAVKVMSADGDIVREARLGALLDHPNVVRTYELTRVGDTWLIAMEHVDGPSMDKVLERGGLPLRATVEAGSQICAALAHAHALEVGGQHVGLVHRDLKPANLMLDPTGLVKVGDFGIAHAAGFGAHVAAGTPPYMSPEQETGALVEASSDIYSLGLVLGELALGTRVDDRVQRGAGRSAHLRQRISEAALDPRLTGLLLHCLALDPTERPTAAALGGDLAALLDECAGTGLPDLVVTRGSSLPWTEELSTPHADTLTIGGSAPNPSVSLLLEAPAPTPDLDAFVGRDTDLTAVSTLMRAERLVTIKGPAGAGKSRLIRELIVGGWLQGRTVRCDLAPARTATDVVATVANAADVPLIQGDPVESVLAALSARGPCLVVLDAVEHLGGELELVTRLLADTANVRILITSRVALPFPSGVQYDLEPLAPSDAVALLEDRSTVDVVGDPALGELAARLDHLPLAIELAAARFGMVSPTQLLARMDRRLSLLRGRDRPGLRAALATSWDLLTPWERDALCQLTAFRGPFRMDVALEVIDLSGHADAPWALDVVGALLDHSLLRERRGRDGARLALYESVRAFAIEQAPHADRDAAALRHLAEFSQYGTTEAIDALHTHGKAAWIRFSEELPELFEATETGLRLDSAQAAVRTVLAAVEIVDTRGPIGPTLELLERVSSFVEGTARGRIHLGRAGMLLRTSNYQDTIAVSELAERDLGEHPHRGRALLRRAAALHFMGSLEPAHAVFDEALAWTRSVGDRRGLGMILGSRALCLLQEGRIQECAEHGLEAAGILGEIGDQRATIVTSLTVGSALWTLGRPDEARERLETGRALAVALGATRLEGLAIMNHAMMITDDGEYLAAMQRTIECFEHVGEQRLLALAWTNSGNRLGAMGRLDEQRAAYDKALGLLTTLGNLQGVASVLANHTNTLIEQGLLDDAEARCTDALEAAERAGATIWEAISQGHMGHLRVRQGRPADARPWLERSVATLHGRFAQPEAVFLSHLGLCLAQLDQPTAALEAFDGAVALLEAGNHRRQLGELYCRWHRSGLSGAEEALRKAVAIADELQVAPGSILDQELTAQGVDRQA